jgi:hypothetical protein
MVAITCRTLCVLLLPPLCDTPPTHTHTHAPPGAARIIEDDLTKFFSGLKLDLQGAELSFMSLTINPGAG